MIQEAFLRNLGLIVIAAAVISLLARRIRVPTIVAYLVAGLALGPWLGWVNLSDTGSLELISEIGIVLLLFLVGLELSLDKIKGVGKVVLWAGLAQMGCTAGGGFILSWALGYSPMESLFLAMAFTFSSTVVAVKLLEEKKQFNSLHGKMAVGILLLQDLAVIILLTLLAGFQPGTGLEWKTMAGNVAKALGGMAVLIAAVLAASRYLLPRPFAWAAQSPETLMLWSLCWCFFIVMAAHLLHLSPESGAFLAGLGLAQLPYNHDLRRRVHPLMNFFIAVFFVSLGVKMQLGSAAAQWPVALAFTAFVLFGKFALIMGTLARLNFGEKTSHFTGVTLSQISEFSFILAAAAVGSGWIGDSVLSMVGLVGLATFSLSAFGILYNEPLYHASRRLGLLKPFRARPEPETADAESTRRGHVIIVGMNTLGRLIAQRLHQRGEQVLAIDTDPRKLAGLPCKTMLGNVEYFSVLEEAGLPHAKLLISALRIEPTNDLLAYRCRCYKIPSSIHVIDLSVTDNLLDMDVSYMMIPKVDGIKLQNEQLKEMGYLHA